MVDSKEAQPKPVTETVLSNREGSDGTTGAGCIHRHREQKA